MSCGQSAPRGGDSAIRYKTSSGRYYVTYCALDGTHNVREWPSENVLANRDWERQAVEEADRLENALRGRSDR